MQKTNAFHNCQNSENKEGEIPQQDESKETEDTTWDPGASGRHQCVKQEMQVTAKEGGLNEKSPYLYNCSFLLLLLLLLGMYFFFFSFY